MCKNHQQTELQRLARLEEQVTVRVDDPSSKLKRGMSGNVEFTLQETE